MSMPMRNGFNFAKVITILAIVFGVSLGACGLTVAAADRWPGLPALGIIEMISMVLSGGGIVVMGLIWVLVSIFGRETPVEVGFDQVKKI